MIRNLINMIETSSGPLNTKTLSKNLGIEESALTGMIEYLARKEKLQDDDKLAHITPVNNSSGICTNCQGPTHCPMMVKVPKTYSLRKKTKTEHVGAPDIRTNHLQGNSDNSS